MMTIPIWAFVVVISVSAMAGFMLAALMDRGDPR